MRGGDNKDNIAGYMVNTHTSTHQAHMKTHEHTRVQRTESLWVLGMTGYLWHGKPHSFYLYSDSQPGRGTGRGQRRGGEGKSTHVRWKSLLVRDKVTNCFSHHLLERKPSSAYKCRGENDQAILNWLNGMVYTGDSSVI